MPDSRTGLPTQRSRVLVDNDLGDVVKALNEAYEKKKAAEAAKAAETDDTTRN